MSLMTLMELLRASNKSVTGPREDLKCQFKFSKSWPVSPVIILAEDTGPTGLMVNNIGIYSLGSQLYA